LAHPITDAHPAPVAPPATAGALLSAFRRLANRKRYLMPNQSPQPPAIYVFEKRLRRARAGAARADIDSLFIIPGTDLRYLIGAKIGSTGGARERLTALLAPADNGPARLMVSNLELSGYEDLALEELGIEVATWADGEDPFRLVAAHLADARRVALSDHTFAMHTMAIRAALPHAEQVLAGPILRALRIRKDPSEIAALRRAGPRSTEFTRGSATG
jgi:Xaa-Pro aminopeptidase